MTVHRPSSIHVQCTEYHFIPPRGSRVRVKGLHYDSSLGTHGEIRVDGGLNGFLGGRYSSHAVFC